MFPKATMVQSEAASMQLLLVEFRGWRMLSQPFLFLTLG